MPAYLFGKATMATRATRVPGRRGRTAIGAIIAAVGALILAGCSSNSGGSTHLVSLSADMSFPYAASSSNCIYDYGKSKGFFSKYGVDPTFASLNGTVALIDEVGAGKVDIGVGAATSNIIQSVTKGTPVKLVAVRALHSLNAVISLEPHPITKPSDVVGKKIAYSPTTLNGLLFNIMLQKNNIDPASVKVIGMNPTAYASALASGSIDGYVSYTNSAVPAQEALGGKPATLLLSAAGVDPIPSDGYIASDSFIKSNPKAITGFLEGSRDTWTYLLKHQDELTAAGEYCAKAQVGVKAALATQQMNLMLAGHADEITQSSFMDIDPQGLDAQVQLLVSLKQLSGPKPVADYYTADLLPKS